MSEALWGQIITGLITIAIASIAAWKASKLGAHEGTAEAIEPVQKTAEKAVKQNVEIIDQNEKIHKQFNSRFDEWKEQMREQTAAAVRAAVQTGINQGIEIERQRVSTQAEDLVATAKGEAERLKEIAKLEAREILAAAKDPKKEEK